MWRRVEDTLDKIKGRVKYVLAKNQDEVANSRHWEGNPHPLEALVKWDKDVVKRLGYKISTRRVSLGRLRILN